MKKILVIDDEDLLIRTMNRLLEKNGHQVYSVKNGQDAVAMIDVEDFDIVISDIRMPGKNGIETIREIQQLLTSKNKKSVAVIFVTGFADKILEEEAAKLSPLAYIHKPFDVSEILKAVNA